MNDDGTNDRSMGDGIDGVDVNMAVGKDPLYTVKLEYKGKKVDESCHLLNKFVTPQKTCQYGVEDNDLPSMHLDSNRSSIICLSSSSNINVSSDILTSKIGQNKGGDNPIIGPNF